VPVFIKFGAIWQQWNSKGETVRRVTLVICLLGFSLLVTTRQYVGNPIDCVHTKDIPEVRRFSPPVPLRILTIFSGIKTFFLSYI
jgi:hypothetical protein